jgi:hypothetical protein
MNTSADTAAQPAIAEALKSWYANHDTVRRLWAIEGPAALEVLVALEPTSDGDDTLPVWLANRRNWASDLREIAQRDVQLRLVVLDDLGEFDVRPGAVTIAELGWRASW